ncbi:hypothetical protein BVX99_03255, partial [bacterium F16]
VRACGVLCSAAGCHKRRVVGNLHLAVLRTGRGLVDAYSMGHLNDWAVRAILVALAYTAAITVVAANETSSKPPKRLAFFPGLILLVTAWMIGREHNWSTFFMPVVMLMAWGAFEALMGAVQVARGTFPVPPFIGRLIRIMLVVQAAWIMMAVVGDQVKTISVLVVFVGMRYLAAWAGRYFYGS